MIIRNRQFRWLRLTALAAALAAVFLVAGGAGLWHTDARGSDIPCPICHVAHMPALQAAPMEALATLAQVAWVESSKTRPGHSELFSLIPPPRAPPA